jgi:hypothetical protein
MLDWLKLWRSRKHTLASREGQSRIGSARQPREGTVKLNGRTIVQVACHVIVST